MRFLTPVFLCLCLFFVSCEPISPALKPETQVSSHHSFPQARSGSFVNSDLLYQWRVRWIDKDSYGWHTIDNNTCLGSLWLYFGQPDNTNGDVIEGNWTVTNESCSGAHTGQQLFDDAQNPYGIGFETWNNIPTYPQRYSFNKATGDVTLTRYVSLGLSIYKTFLFRLATDKQLGFLTCYSPYNDMLITRETGGPSVP